MNIITIANIFNNSKYHAIDVRRVESRVNKEIGGFEADRTTS
jgi:hypothetical protein